MIEPEDFDAWRDNAITQALFAKLRAKAEEAKAKWLSDSWNGGKCDELMLADLRARAETWTDLCEMTLEELEAEVGDDHEA